LPVVVAALLSACGSGVDGDAKPGIATNQAAPALRPDEGRPVRPSELHGTSWRIRSIGGRPVEAPREDGGETRYPQLRFGRDWYGGTGGCNFLGGMGFVEAGRLYTLPGPQTLVGCSERLGWQDNRLSAILASSPPVRRVSPQEVVIGTRDVGLLLSSDGPCEECNRTPDPIPTITQASAWRFRLLNGEALARPGELVFRNGQVTARAACATLNASVAQSGNRLRLTGPLSTTEQLCPPEEADRDAALAAILSAGPMFAVGPNGELLLASAAGAIGGERER